MSAVAHIDEYKTGKFYSNEFRGEMSWNGYENNVLLRNEGLGEEGGPRFIDVAMALGADDQRDARGVAIADFDNDGDLDVAVNHNPGDNDDLTRRRATLLRNDIGHHRAWLAVELEGRQGNRDAVGAVVVLEAGGLLQTRQVTAGSGYASQQSRRLYFGLGEAESIDRISIRWPGGGEWQAKDLAPNRLLRLVEGEEPELLPLPGGG